ncbi:hypothetical protein FVER14953_08188 [Fusarium verticillioides]|nr:hypothetical protein FVER14953_08188 [Fusarium verticillioides]
MGTSMKAAVDYLDTVDKDMAQVAKGWYSKLMHWADDPQEYGLEYLATSFQGYEKDIVAMLKDILSNRIEYSAALDDGTEFHSGEQNARVVKYAEQYYKAMCRGRDETWNLRDTHMFESLTRLLEHRGSDSKAIVWAHNSHVGDARATSMGWSREELNTGQLCKERSGVQAVSIGTGTNTGTVAAAQDWDGNMNIMELQPGLPGSYEELMHVAGIDNIVLDLRKGKCDEKLPKTLNEKRLERLIGVLYRPEMAKASHYLYAVLPEQFDGFIWFDKSKHLGTFEVRQPKSPRKYHRT